MHMEISQIFRLNMSSGFNSSNPINRNVHVVRAMESCADWPLRRISRSAPRAAREECRLTPPSYPKCFVAQPFVAYSSQWKSLNRGHRLATASRAPVRYTRIPRCGREKQPKVNECIGGYGCRWAHCSIHSALAYTSATSCSTCCSCHAIYE